MAAPPLLIVVAFCFGLFFVLRSGTRPAATIQIIPKSDPSRKPDHGVAVGELLHMVFLQKSIPADVLYWILDDGVPMRRERRRTLDITLDKPGEHMMSVAYRTSAGYFTANSRIKAFDTRSLKPKIRDNPTKSGVTIEVRAQIDGWALTGLRLRLQDPETEKSVDVALPAMSVPTPDKPAAYALSVTIAEGIAAHGGLFSRI